MSTWCFHIVVDVFFLSFLSVIYFVFKFTPFISISFPFCALSWSISFLFYDFYLISKPNLFVSVLFPFCAPAWSNPLLFFLSFTLFSTRSIHLHFISSLCFTLINSLSFLPFTLPSNLPYPPPSVSFFALQPDQVFFSRSLFTVRCRTLHLIYSFPSLFDNCAKEVQKKKPEGCFVGAFFLITFFCCYAGAVHFTFLYFDVTFMYPKI